MKICQYHWEKLRTRIKENGMWHLVAPSGQAAIERMKKEIEGQKTVFDPLMACNNMISGNAIQMGGLYLMMKKEDGSDYCPLCEVELNKEKIGAGGDDWIEKAVSSCVDYCRENNLLNQN